MRGLSEIPAGLAELVADAPQRAVERVFDAALNEHVDFMLLAGDILQPTAAGPRSLVLLSSNSSDCTLATFRFIGPRGASTPRRAGPTFCICRRTFIWRRAGASNIGNSSAKAACRPRSWAAPPTNNTSSNRPGSDRRRIGGDRPRPRPAGSTGRRGARGSLLGLGRQPSPPRRSESEVPVVHYPGTPQGRSPNESGPHGCTLVQIDDAHTLRTRFVPTDLLRWHTETIQLDAHMHRADLERQIDQRAQALLATPGEPQWLVRWRVQAPPALAVKLRRDEARRRNC